MAQTKQQTGAAEKYLLSSNLDELFKELHSLADLRTQTDLCYHPELNFIKPPQE